MPSAAGLLVFAVTMVMLRRGIRCSPDGWAYWQASVSILDGLGCRDFYGLPVDAWPPLYPLYLAGWQWFLGVSGSTLVLATSCTAGLAATLWLRFFLGLHPRDARSAKLISLYVVAFMSLNAHSLMAGGLVLCILPVVLGLLLRARGQTQAPRFLGNCLLAALGLGLAVSARHASMAYLGGFAFVLLMSHKQPARLRIAGAAIAVFVPIVIWQGLRIYLDQASAHPVGFGQGKYSAISYAWQFSYGLGANIAPIPIGIAVWLLATWHLLRSPRSSAGARLLICFALISSLCLFAMFNLTFVVDRLKGRFVAVPALLTVGALLLTEPTIRAGWLRALVILACLGQPVARTCKQMVMGRVPDADPLIVGEQVKFVYKQYVIHRDHMTQSVEPAGDLIYVRPPLFPWMREQLEGK